MGVSSRIFLSGEKTVAGIGVGKLFFIDTDSSLIPHLNLFGGEDAVKKEVERLEEAVRFTERSIFDIIEQKLMPQEALDILEVHRMMITDPTLIDKIKKHIEIDNINAEWALIKVVDKVVAFFNKSGTDYYIQAKITDIEVIKGKLLNSLMGSEDFSSYLTKLPEGDFVVCAQTLTVTELASIAKNSNVKGVALETPGGVSHITVVLRSLGIPAVMGVKDLVEKVSTGGEVVVDGVRGEVVINPSDKEKSVYCDRKRIYDDYFTRFLEDVDSPSVSKDGIELSLGANIEIPGEVDQVRKFGGENIGLFRTEMMFLESESIPNEEMHYSIYYELLHRSSPMPVTIRVFDFGGDKEGKVITSGSMGLRGIRFCFANESIFRPQLRALIRVASFGNLKILLPFVSSVCEIRTFRAMLSAEAESMGLVENIKKVKIGAMIELPSTLFIADILAQEVDFFSIGTNDLIQYMNAVERQDKSLSRYFSHFHPAVIRAIDTIVKISDKYNIETNICGEMGGDPYLTLVFLGMGIHSLSMSPISIPIIKKIIRSGFYEEGRIMREKLLLCSTESEINSYLTDEMSKKYPNVFKEIWINNKNYEGEDDDGK